MTGRRARRPGTVLAGASAAQAAVSLVNFGLPAIGPELQDEFGLSLFELGAVLSAGILGSGVVLVGVGSLVDRFGARLTMVLGTAIGSLGLAAAALAGSKTAFFLAVLASGIGSAVAPIAGTGALFRVYPPATRGRALGVRQTAVPLGGAIAAVAFPALYAIGGTELTLGFAATAVAVTGLWFALVIPSERIVREPGAGGSVRTILRTPGVRTLLAVAACYITVLSALVAYLVPAVRESGHSELTASIAFFAVNIAAMAARIAWGWVADRGRRDAARPGARRGRGPRGRGRRHVRARAAPRPRRGGARLGRLRARRAGVERARLRQRGGARRPVARRPFRRGRGHRRLRAVRRRDARARRARRRARLGCALGRDRRDRAARGLPGADAARRRPSRGRPPEPG